MIKARLIVYEGDEEWMASQMANSLPEGIKRLSSRNTIIVLNITDMMVASMGKLVAELRETLQAIEDKVSEERREEDAT